MFGDPFESPTGFNFMFSVFPVIFFLILAVVMATFIITIVRGAGQYRKNNRSPVLNVGARVVTKRADVRHHHHHSGDNMDHVTSSTDYYVTFEVASGDRMEFSVGGSEYAMLAEGDEGELTFQGTRYKGFERRR